MDIGKGVLAQNCPKLNLEHATHSGQFCSLFFKAKFLLNGFRAICSFEVENSSKYGVAR